MTDVKEKKGKKRKPNPLRQPSPEVSGESESPPALAVCCTGPVCFWDHDSQSCAFPTDEALAFYHALYTHLSSSPEAVTLSLADVKQWSQDRKCQFVHDVGLDHDHRLPTCLEAFVSVSVSDSNAIRINRNCRLLRQFVVKMLEAQGIPLHFQSLDQKRFVLNGAQITKALDIMDSVFFAKTLRSFLGPMEIQLHTDPILGSAASLVEIQYPQDLSTFVLSLHSDHMHPGVMKKFMDCHSDLESFLIQLQHLLMHAILFRWKGKVIHRTHDVAFLHLASQCFGHPAPLAHVLHGESPCHLAVPFRKPNPHPLEITELHRPWLPGLLLAMNEEKTTGWLVPTTTIWWLIQESLGWSIPSAFQITWDLEFQRGADDRSDDSPFCDCIAILDWTQPGSEVTIRILHRRPDSSKLNFLILLLEHVYAQFQLIAAHGLAYVHNEIRRVHQDPVLFKKDHVDVLQAITGHDLSLTLFFMSRIQWQYSPSTNAIATPTLPPRPVGTQTPSPCKYIRGRGWVLPTEAGPRDQKVSPSRTCSDVQDRFQDHPRTMPEWSATFRRPCDLVLVPRDHRVLWKRTLHLTFQHMNTKVPNPLAIRNLNHAKLRHLLYSITVMYFENTMDDFLQPYKFIIQDSHKSSSSSTAAAAAQITALPSMEKKKETKFMLASSLSKSGMQSLFENTLHDALTEDEFVLLFVQVVLTQLIAIRWNGLVFHQEAAADTIWFVALAHTLFGLPGAWTAMILHAQHALEFDSISALVGPSRPMNGSLLLHDITRTLRHLHRAWVHDWNGGPVSDKEFMAQLSQKTETRIVQMDRQRHLVIFSLDPDEKKNPSSSSLHRPVAQWSLSRFREEARKRGPYWQEVFFQHVWIHIQCIKTFGMWYVEWQVTQRLWNHKGQDPDLFRWQAWTQTGDVSSLSCDEHAKLVDTSVRAEISFSTTPAPAPSQEPIAQPDYSLSELQDLAQEIGL